MFNILIACEESQEVLSAVIKHVQGVDVRYTLTSCDMQAASGEHPDRHYQGDVRDLLAREDFDLVIAFPPCTHLASSGARWFAEKRASGVQAAAISFFRLFADLDVPHIAVENPVGIMSSEYRRPDQYVQPHFFGSGVDDAYTKKTGFWLKGLPLLQRTHTLEKESIDKTRIHYVSPGEDRSKIRSKTPPGLAREIALQWVAPLIP